MKRSSSKCRQLPGHATKHSSVSPHHPSDKLQPHRCTRNLCHAHTPPTCVGGHVCCKGPHVALQIVPGLRFHSLLAQQRFGREGSSGLQACDTGPWPSGPKVVSAGRSGGNVLKGWDALSLLACSKGLYRCSESTPRIEKKGPAWWIANPTPLPQAHTFPLLSHLVDSKSHSQVVVGCTQPLVELHELRDQSVSRRSTVNSGSAAVTRAGGRKRARRAGWQRAPYPQLENCCCKNCSLNACSTHSPPVLDTGGTPTSG